MKKTLGIFFVLVFISSMVLFHIPKVSELRSYPTSTLVLEERNFQIQFDALSLSDVSDRADKKNDLRLKITWYKIELARRNYSLEWLSMLAGIFGVFLILSKFLKKKDPEPFVKKAKVVEVLPSEIYVDEREFYQRKQDGFTSKEHSLEWFETDPLKVCSYCGSEDVKPVRGQQDEVQLITFYKKVPEGATDLRIILGSYWYVKAAKELRCENCKQKVIR